MKRFISILLITFSISTNAQQLYFPPIIGNVWDSILPSNLNYCQARIDSLYNYLQAKDTKSFIILKDGKRVLEKYFGTYTKDSTWYWASASKSLTSFITGMAQQKGYISINNKVSSYINTGWTSAPLAKENMITVKYLLQMNSGLNDSPPTPCDNEDTTKTCLLYLADAGTRWAYHTGAYKKLQDLVSKTVGQSYNAITNNWIETKTGMSGFWYQQVYYSKARDMARFGLLNLNKGIWNTDTLMKDSMYFKAMVNTSQSLNKAYGYLWWLNGKASGMGPGYQIVFPGSLMPNAPADMFCALGKNDQKIYVIPSKNMVIVRQGNTAGGFNLAASAFDNVLWDYINKLDCGFTNVKNQSTQVADLFYPNPVADILTIDNFALHINKIQVYDLFGKIYQTENIVGEDLKLNLNVSYLNTGLYFIEVTHKNHQTARYKFLKQ
jgi:CubicO group peptidase (beta-lactamase class C family)